MNYSYPSLTEFDTRFIFLRTKDFDKSRGYVLSLTTNPITPMSTKPMATACEILRNSFLSAGKSKRQYMSVSFDQFI